MTTTPQRLREIARSVHEMEYGQPGALADSLRAIAAELEAPAADAVQVVAWLYTESGHGACEPKCYLSKIDVDHACKVFNGAQDPLIRQIDHIATVSALQARIDELEARWDLCSACSKEIEPRKVPDYAKELYVVVWECGSVSQAGSLRQAKWYLDNARTTDGEYPTIVRYVPAEMVPYEPHQDTSKEQP